jgi:hypothetical protein
MSMTAAEIAGVVGTERKAWWPGDILWDAHEDGWYSDHLRRRPSDDITELAFIGAAVAVLAQRYEMVRLEIGVKYIITTREFNSFDNHGVSGQTLLHALVAALKESEGA